MRAIVLSAAFTALFLSSCAGSPWPARTPAAIPSGASTLNLPTLPPAEPQPAGVEWACPSALIGDVRVLREGDAVAFEWVPGGRVRLVWPRGFTAWLRDDQAEIVAPDGSVIAREGDVIQERLVGVEDGICEVDGVLYPPAS